MGKVLVAGSIVVDMSVSVIEHPSNGQTVIGKNLSYSPGGKGFNQAVSAYRLGADVAMIGKVGDDQHGDMFKEEVSSENIKGYIATSWGKETGIAMIMVDREGYNNIVVIPGANDDLSTEDVDKFFETYNEKDNILVAQCETPLEVTKYFFTKGKNANSINIFNPAPAKPIKEDILNLVDILIMNETELEVVSGVDWLGLWNIDDLKESMKRISSEYYMFDKIIITTMGDKGVLALYQGEFLQIEGIKVDVVDTTGAGDCFTGAIAAYCFENKISTKEDLLSALNFANKAASISVTQKGSSLSMPYLEDIYT